MKQTLSLMLGASTALSNNKITIELSRPLMGQDSFYLVSYRITSPSTAYIRVRFLSPSSLRANQNVFGVPTISTVNLMSGDAVFILGTGATEKYEYNNPRPATFITSPNNQVGNVTLEVTDWGGLPITYADFALEFMSLTTLSFPRISPLDPQKLVYDSSLRESNMMNV
jgi:hypothetical protein